MPELNWTQLLSASVVPVVIVSAGGLLASALYHRFTAVVTRVRTFHRERIQYQEQLLHAQTAGTEGETALGRRRSLLAMLEAQTQNGTRRAYQVRRALTCVLACIGLELGSSLFTGLAVLLSSHALGFIAAALFLAGLVLALIGVGWAMRELALSLSIIDAEGEFIAAWGRTNENAEPK